MTRTEPYTTAELVALFGVTRPTIHRWCHQGWLEVVGTEEHNSLGAKRLLISPESVERVKIECAALRASGKHRLRRPLVPASTE